MKRLMIALGITAATQIACSPAADTDPIPDAIPPELQPQAASETPTEPPANPVRCDEVTDETPQTTICCATAENLDPCGTKLTDCQSQEEGDSIMACTDKGHTFKSCASATCDANGCTCRN